MKLQDLVLVLAFLFAAVALAGCGSLALKTNAQIARAMLTVQEESGPLIRSTRVDAVVATVQASHAAGEPESVARQRADELKEDWQCAIEAHRIFSFAVGAYIDALVLVNAGADFQMVDVLPFVARAVNTYRALSSCLSTLGHGDVLPVPDFLSLIPTEWSIP